MKTNGFKAILINQNPHKHIFRPKQIFSTITHNQPQLFMQEFSGIVQCIVILIKKAIKRVTLSQAMSQIECYGIHLHLFSVIKLYIYNFNPFFLLLLIDNLHECTFCQVIVQCSFLVSSIVLTFFYDETL